MLHLRLQCLSPILLAAAIGGCGNAVPAHTSTSAPSGTPVVVASISPGTLEPTEPAVTPSLPASQFDSPLTDVEASAITSGALIAIPADAPPVIVDAAAAEAIVRTTYTGERATIEVRRIALQHGNRIVVGWLVALSPRSGAPCPDHPGLLPRAIEGGIVDDQTGDMFWSMTCG